MKLKIFLAVTLVGMLGVFCIIVFAQEPPAEVDIGLRIWDGGAEPTKFACEPEGTLASPLRIAKNGTIYGIVLVDPSDPRASKTRILTKSGVKSLAIWYEYVLADETEVRPPTDYIRRPYTGGCPKILVILKLNGVGKDDIVDEPLTLYPLSCPGSISSSSHFIFGTFDKSQIQAWFDTVSFLNLTAPYIGDLSALPGYGKFKVKVVGKLKSGQYFYGIGTITIGKFAGC